MKSMRKTFARVSLLVLALMMLFTIVAFAEGTDVATAGTVAVAEVGEVEEVTSIFYQTAWALLPPVIAIILALLTKEVYSLRSCLQQNRASWQVSS